MRRSPRVVPSGSVTPLAVSEAVAAEEVVEAATDETVAVTRGSAEVVASEVATTLGEVVGMATKAAEVALTAPTALGEVARTASELVLLLALHADFLDEVAVVLE